MSGEWITFEAAVEMLRARTGWSVGRCGAMVRAARDSGEVRSYKPPDPVLLMADDGLVGMDMRPGAQNRYGVTADGKPVTHKIISASLPQDSKDDLLDWLGRQPNEAVPKPKQSKRHPQLKQDRAREAINALWPNGLPEPTGLSNKRLCTMVINWLKDDCKKRKIAFEPLSDTVILRAAGRKK